MSNINYNNKLQGYQSNSKDLFVAVYDASGGLMDLSGFDGFLYAKKFPINPDLPLDISTGATSIDPSNGSLYFGLTPTQMDLVEGDYVYEVIIDNGSGDVITVINDRLNILKSIR